MKMNLEPKAEAFIAAMAAANFPAIETLSPGSARAAMTSLRANREPQSVLVVEDKHVGSTALRIYSDEEVPKASILYMHGGGWVLGSLDDSDAFCRSLANATRARVISVGYSLSPEASYPAAIEDGMLVLDWLAQSYPVEPILLLGDSAGGNLVATMARRARDRGRPAVLAQILAYPVVDAAMDTPSYTEFAQAPLLSAATMRWFWDHYLSDHEERLKPDASPIRGELGGLPTAFVLTAENDLLRDEGEAFAAALMAAGVATEVRRYGGQIHGFLTIGIFDGSKRALSDITMFIDRVILNTSKCLVRSSDGLG